MGLCGPAWPATRVVGAGLPSTRENRYAIFELEADEVLRGAQVTRARESERGFAVLAHAIVERAI
jgi:chromosome partitioning protein